MNQQTQVKHLSEYLVQSGIKPSFQRIKILQRLNEKKDHPTVNDIYSDLVLQIPSLSKTTVYNTLNLFVKEGVAKEINLSSAEARYDGVTENHGHFVCTSCGKIYDFEIEQHMDLTFLEKQGFDIHQYELNIKGVCKNCKQD